MDKTKEKTKGSKGLIINYLKYDKFCVWAYKCCGQAKCFFVSIGWSKIKHRPLEPNSRDSLITRANLAKRGTFFSTLWRMLASPAKLLGECRRAWRIFKLGCVMYKKRYLPNSLNTRRVRVTKICWVTRFRKFEYSPKTASFGQVLQLAKFTRE
jgi:hypothetical protein